MERNIDKVLNEYQALTTKKKGRFGNFYASDIKMLWDKHGVKHPPEGLYHLTGDALEYGFMIGYKAAKRENR